jgi:glycosyltransferase involved in cell wall biosynthesis
VRVLLTIHHQLDRDLGAPGATLQLGEALRAAGHDIGYLSFDDFPARTPPRLRELLFPEWLAVRLAGLARRGLAPDVVDATTGDAWLWGALRRRLPGPRRPALVTRGHGLEHVFWAQELAEAEARGSTPPLLTRLYHGGLRLREVEASLRAADLCVFLNVRDRAYAIERLGIGAPRTRVVANGVPAAFLGRPLEPRGDGPLRVAQVGSWTARKGARYTAAALDGLLTRRDDIEATLVGTHASEAAVLADLVPAVRHRVRVVPRFTRDELPALLEGHHVSLLPSLAEGFSLALVETMACGLAPVTTPLATEIVRDDVSGIIIPARDAPAIERALETLADDRARLERLRRGASEVAQRFSWAQIAGETAELYGEAREISAAC